MEHCSIRLSRSRKKSSSMTTWWRWTTRASRCGSIPLSQCRSRWPQSGWFALAFFAVLVEGHISARTALQWKTANSSQLCSWRKFAFGIDKSSRIATYSMAQWRRSRVASAAKSAFTSRSFAFWWCSTSSLLFSLLGQRQTQHPFIDRLRNSFIFLSF